MASQTSLISIRGIMFFCWIAAILEISFGYSLQKVSKYQKTNSNQEINRNIIRLSASQVQDIEISFFDKLINSLGLGTKKKSTDSFEFKLPSIKKEQVIRKIPKTKVLIIGSGMSGLACATEFMSNGFTDFLMVDSADKPGGRVRTDSVDG